MAGVQGNIIAQAGITSRNAGVLCSSFILDSLEGWSTGSGSTQELEDRIVAGMHRKHTGARSLDVIWVTKAHTGTGARNWKRHWYLEQGRSVFLP